MNKQTKNLALAGGVLCFCGVMALPSTRGSIFFGGVRFPGGQNILLHVVVDAFLLLVRACVKKY